MRMIGIILLYFVAVFVGGALAAPWVHALTVRLAGDVPALQGLADEPFRRYVSRSWMILGIAGLWPLCRALGQTTLASVGLKTGPNATSQAGRGFFLGFLTLAVASLLTVGLGPREWQLEAEASRWMKHLFNAAAAAVVVGFIEEVFFRGVLFGALCRKIDWRAALLVSSAAYALLHFMERADPSGPVTWSTGLALTPRMLRGIAHVETLFPMVINLTVAGGLLALAFRRTGSLWFSIGLHAGWIFWLKSFGFMTADPPGGAGWFWGTRKLIDGWLCLPLLLAAVPLVLKLKPGTSSGASPELHGDRQNVA